MDKCINASKFAANYLSNVVSLLLNITPFKEIIKATSTALTFVFFLKRIFFSHNAFRNSHLSTNNDGEQIENSYLDSPPTYEKASLPTYGETMHSQYSKNNPPPTLFFIPAAAATGINQDCSTNNITHSHHQRSNSY